MNHHGWLLMCVVAGLCLASVAAAQSEPAEPDAAAQRAPLASKQEIVLQRIQRLEDRMYRLSESLRPTQPEQAERLTEAVRQARELRLARTAEQVAELLSDDELAQAVRAQEQLLVDLNALLASLLDEQADLDRLQEQMQRLAAIRAELDKIINRQTADRDQTELHAKASEQSERLQSAIEAVEKLRDRQQELSGQSGPPATLRQQRLGNDTREAAEQFRSQPPTGQSEAGAKQDAAEDLEQAAEDMDQATEKLRRDADEQAREDQQAATDKLEQAIQRLRKEAQRLADLDPSKLAEDQRDTAERTGQLAKQMQGDQSQAGGQQQSPAAQQPQPGQQPMQQAHQHMQQAIQQLEQQQPQQALPQQQEALNQLDQARRDLDEALEQLRREQHEEMLAAIEVRIAALLAREQEIYDGTVALDDKPAEEWNRQDELLAADLARQQSDLADQAGRLLFILQEEGSTVAFPLVLQQVQQDMNDVAGRLAVRRTGVLTQQMEQEIIAALTDLLEAVHQAQDQSMLNMPMGGQPNPMRPPALLPGSAELKLLRASQVRVNERTEAINALRGKTAALPPEDARQLARTAERQEAVSQLARQLFEQTSEAQP